MFQINVSYKTENEFDSALGGSGLFRKLISLIVGLWPTKPEGVEDKTISFHIKHMKDWGITFDNNVVICRSLLKKSKSQLVSILIHELCHVWQMMTHKLILSDCGKVAYWKGKKRLMSQESHDNLYLYRPWEVQSRVEARRAHEVISLLEANTFSENII